VSETTNRKSWEDWGAVDPMYAIITDPQFRFGGGDLDYFFSTGEETITEVMGECKRLGLCAHRGQALDFGCGIGRLTAPLADHFESVVGLDIASSMIEQARRIHGDRCQFAVQYGDDLAMYPTNSFDLVNCLLVLQHLPTRALMERYMSEFVRILRPGGALVLQLSSKVPSPTPLPPWKTKEGAQKRLALELRRWGVKPDYLYRRLEWVPEMTMTAISDVDARAVLAAAGGEVRFATEPSGDVQTEGRIYYVTC